MDFIHWNLDPDIVRLGSFPLRWYSLFFAGGIYLGMLRVRAVFRESGKTDEQLNRLFMYFFFGTILGARLGHCLFYEPSYYLARPWEIIIPPYQGLASHGGVLGITIAVVLFLRKETSFRFLWLGDALSLGIAIGVPFIRIGNFMNSEIIGVPTSVPWAVVFERFDSLPRHPAQLYEAVSYLLVALVLYLLYRYKPVRLGSGRLLGTLLVGIFSARFLIEYVKIEQVGFEEGMVLNMGQILSIPAILLGLWLLCRKDKILISKPN